MDTQQKLDILSRDAQYDLSCACGTKNPLEHRKRNRSGDGWLYPTTTASGGPGIILKTLLGNRCANDCKYCPLRMQKDFSGVAISPEEMASFFYTFQLKRPLLGLFLSSAVLGDPERTMAMLVDTAAILRKRYRYRGYIHLKVIPGASRASIDAAMSYASAVSLNIEAPGPDFFSRLTDRKDYRRDIVEPLAYIASRTRQKGRHRIHTSSQFIVGASDETDRDILFCGNDLYASLGMDRLYFSAYQRGLGDPSIPGEQIPEDDGPAVPSDAQLQFDLGLPPVSMDRKRQELLVREHRLYQADWLLRKYRFAYGDLMFDENGNLSLDKDPKRVWAENHPDYFPVSVKHASREQLLRVPGIGPGYAEKIVRLRSQVPLSDLLQLRLPQSCLKRSEGFLIL